MKGIRTFTFLLLAVVVCLVGCNQDKIAEQGTLIIEVDSGMSKGIEAISMETASYNVTVKNSSESVVFYSSGKSQNSYTVSVPAGTYTVYAEALNSEGDVIGTGSATAAVVAGQVNSFIITVTEVAGNGTFSISIAANEGYPLAYSIKRADGTEIKGGNLSYSDGRYTVSEELPNGFYLFTIKRTDTNKVLKTDTLRVIKDKSAFYSATFQFMSGGSILIINEICQNPVITLNPSSMVIKPGDVLSVSASITLIEDYSCYWVLDGVPLSPAIEYEAFEHEFAEEDEGEHKIALFVTNGNVIWSESVTVRVSDNTISGELVLLSAGRESDSNLIIEAFNREYPNISVSHIESDSSVIMSLIQNGDSNADVALFLPEDTLISISEQLFPYKNINDLKISENLKDADGRWYASSLPLQTIMYNTDILKGDDIPDSWFDLADPKYNGMIVLANPSSSGSAYAQLYMMYKLTGDLSLAEDIAKNGTVYVTNTMIGPQAVARGEYALTITSESNISSTMANGSPVNYLYLQEGTGRRIEGSGIIDGCDNNEIAKLFMDWFTGKGGAEVIMSMGRRAASTEVPGPGTLPSLNELTLFDYDAIEAAQIKKQLRNDFGALLDPSNDNPDDEGNNTTEQSTVYFSRYWPGEFKLDDGTIVNSTDEFYARHKADSNIYVIYYPYLIYDAFVTGGGFLRTREAFRWYMNTYYPELGFDGLVSQNNPDDLISSILALDFVVPDSSDVVREIYLGETNERETVFDDVSKYDPTITKYELRSYNKDTIQLENGTPITEDDFYFSIDDSNSIVYIYFPEILRELFEKIDGGTSSDSGDPFWMYLSIYYDDYYPNIGQGAATLVETLVGHFIEPSIDDYISSQSILLHSAFQLADGESMEGTQVITGIIVAIPSAYSETYDNITVNIEASGHIVQAYRLTGGEDLAVGDKITVSGTLKNYKGTIEIVKGSYTKI